MCFELTEIFFQQDVARSDTANTVLDTLNTRIHDQAISKRSPTVEQGQHRTLFIVCCV